MTIFTITPDFNSPPDPDGSRTEIVHSKWIVEGYREGRYSDSIKPGATIIAYFDPEGEGKSEYEAGWSAMATIDRVEAKGSRYMDGDFLWITYHLTEPA